jgi:uncharacterized protein DUF6152
MRTTSRLALLALMVAFVAGQPGLAHHSVSGQFDVSKTVTLTGVISKVDWVNPHVYVFLDVKGTNGTVTTWALETVPTAMMRKAGLNKLTVAGKPGEVVTVSGNPGRDTSKSMAWIHRITYADGHFVQLAPGN